MNPCGVSRTDNDTETSNNAKKPSYASSAKRRTPVVERWKNGSVKAKCRRKKRSNARKPRSARAKKRRRAKNDWLLNVPK